LDPGMTVGLVEVPQPAHLMLEVVGGEDPVLVLDHLPDFERKPREGDRRGIPILVRLLLPFRPHLVVAPADRRLALGNALLENRIAGDASPADAGELGDAERGVAERADRAWLHAAVIHRPFADADFA